MKILLGKIRDDARDAVRARMRAAGDRGEIETPDYLKMLVESARPDEKPWQDLVSVVAMSRMLVQIGRIEAARELVRIYVRFGEFLRVDTQLSLAKMGNKGVAALIEAQTHQAEKIASWAGRQLDTLGKVTIAEAVQTDDYDGLADILRAFGRVRDPEAARVVISFANSERAQVREAARQSVALMGEVALWQLRDTYENTIGKRPPRDWSWQRTARELFGEFDRLRLSRVHKDFEAGLAAQSKGDFARMREAFDKVLTRNPNFERRSEMVDGYVEYARRHADHEREAAILALSRAVRIDADKERSKRTESLLSTLRAEALSQQSIADITLLRRAIELDPQNDRARRALDQLERGEQLADSRSTRYVAAGAILAAALAAIAVIGIVRFRERRWREPRPDAGDASQTARADGDVGADSADGA
jgi:tetratricopeptide (TPR) repeat protein